MSQNKDEIYLADMSACKPAEVLIRGRREMTWNLVDYETESGMKGIMAYADPKLGAPEIQLPLNAKGQYKVYLGINYTKSPFGYQRYGAYGNVDVKLTRDKGFKHVGGEYGAVEQPMPKGIQMASKMGVGKFVPRSIQEVYWKTAELDGQSLHIRPLEEPYRTEFPGIANLSYVWLVPVTEDEAALEEALQKNGDTKRMAFIYCTGNLSGHIDNSPADFHPTDAQWFMDEFTSCLNSDFSIFNLEVIRGSYCTYKTKIGDVGGEDGVWKDEWLDPLEEFTKVAHENGMKIFGAMRMIGTAYPNTASPMARASFYWENQQWAKRDRHGMPAGNLSIAFPEVRNYWLSLLREVLEYGVDGITIYYHRFRPFVLWEDPVVEAFIEKNGDDPRKLHDHEPRWLQHRADYATGFLAEIRELVNEYPGKELAVTFHGGPSPFDPDEGFHPMRDTMDVPAWLEKGLVDYLMPTMKPRFDLVREWKELAGDRVQIWPDLQSSGKWGKELIDLAEEYYQAGADGFCLWDCERLAPAISEWAVRKHLGHREQFDDLKKQVPHYWRRVPLRYLNGLATKYSFNNYAHTDPLLGSEG